jgi:transposase
LKLPADIPEIILPTLRQFMMNLICVGDGDIPVLMEIASENQSDKTRFAQLFQEFSKQWAFDGLCVVDGALLWCR